MEQAARVWHAEEAADAHATGRLAEDGYVGGIASERLDVVAHPGDCEQLIEKTDVCAGFDLAAEEVLQVEGAEAVLQGHDHDVAAPCEPGTVVDRLASTAEHEGAAVDPHHHRPATVVKTRGPDVQRQAVLARLLDAEADGRLLLGGGGPEPGGREDARPRRGRTGRGEPQLSQRRPGEWNATKREEIVAAFAFDLPDPGLHHSRRRHARNASAYGATCLTCGTGLPRSSVLRARADRVVVCKPRPAWAALSCRRSTALSN